jgi:uncharacterized cupredoxin-like copper-binding protein
MNGDDMARLGLVDGDLVGVTSRRGAIVLPAQRSAAQAPAQVFIAMHWGEEFVSGRGSGGAIDRDGGGGAFLAGVNALTQPAFCAQSKQPELKHAAVKVERAELPARVLALAWLSDERALAVREALRPLMTEFAFAAPETVPATEFEVTAVNNGEQPHEMGVIPLKEGAPPLEELVKLGDKELQKYAAGPFAGTEGPIKPGESKTFTLDGSQAASFGFACFVKDPETKKPHVQLGMAGQFIVE